MSKHESREQRLAEIREIVEGCRLHPHGPVIRDMGWLLDEVERLEQQAVELRGLIREAMDEQHPARCPWCFGRHGPDSPKQRAACLAWRAVQGEQREDTP